MLFGSCFCKPDHSEPGEYFRANASPSPVLKFLLAEAERAYRPNHFMSNKAGPGTSCIEGCPLFPSPKAYLSTGARLLCLLFSGQEPAAARLGREYGHGVARGR